MRTSHALLLLVAACGSNGNLVVTTTMTVTTVSGAGPSPLDPLDGQPFSIEITFAGATSDHDDQNGCIDTVLSTDTPVKVATGPSADLVQSGVLDILPEWDARLELCNPTSGSTASLRSDNQAGLGLSFGCQDLPASAIEIENNHPVWTTFSSTACDITLWDELHGRLFGGTNVTMKFQK